MRKISAILVVIFIITYICLPALNIYAQGEEITISGEYEEDESGVNNTAEPGDDINLDGDGLPESSPVTEIDPQPNDTKINQEETPNPENPAIDTQTEETPKLVNLVMDIEQEKQEGYVYSFEDLQEWLDENEGGAVNLGANIAVPSGKSIQLGSDINAGDFGFIVEGDLRLNPELTITGTGVLQPVVEVKSGGKLYINNNETLEIAPCITATGDDACALALREGSEYDQSPFAFMKITANGRNAVALKSEIPLDLNCHFIKAAAGNGIICSENVALFLCNISSGAASVQASALTADTSALFPKAVGNVTEIPREIVEISDNRDVIALHDPIPDYYYTDSRMRVNAVLRAEGAPDIIMATFVTLELPPIDTDVTGSYSVKVIPEEWMRIFDLVPDTATLYTIEVCDFSIPVFDMTSSSRGMYYISYYYRADDLEGLTLWRSDDEGASWYDFTADAELDYWGDVLTLIFDGIEEHPVLFVFEVAGLGESKILRVTWDNFTINADIGGDRNGGDRGENDLPVDSILPPTSTTAPTPPSNSGATAKSTSSSSGKTSTPSTVNTPADTDGTAETIPANASSTLPATDTSKPPQSSPTSADSPADPTEYSDQTSVTVSGERLAVMMAANPEYVSFLQGELRVSIPTAFLESLSISPSDSFTVTLYKPDSSTFFVSFMVNGSELSDQLTEPFLVCLPWSGDPVSCTDKTGEIIDGVMDTATNRATFSLHHTGTYSIVEQAVQAVSMNLTKTSDSAENTQTLKPYSDDFTPIAIVGSISLVGVGAFLGFTHRRRVRQS